MKIKNLELNIINIKWQGPKGLRNIKNFNNQTNNFGVYQVYGPHPIHGKDCLLYIGKAQ